MDGTNFISNLLVLLSIPLKYRLAHQSLNWKVHFQVYYDLVEQRQKLVPVKVNSNFAYLSLASKMLQIL